MNKRLIVAIFVALLLVSNLGCINTQSFDEEKERAIILQLLADERTYHFEKMAPEFAATLSPITFL